MAVHSERSDASQESGAISGAGGVGPEATIRHAPLAGIRVLAVESYLAGPFGSMILADFGADVIKIEPPAGDVYRNRAPIYENEHGRMSYSFGRMNRNKSSVVLDLKDRSGMETFWSLVDGADVVWENLRAGALERLGLGWEALHSRNPRLIYASLSGFGHSDLLPSPYQDRPAFDLIAQALSGLMFRPGDDSMPPLYLGVPMADQISGMYGALGVLLALRLRSQTGEGHRVDISMVDVMTALMDQPISDFSYRGEEPQRGLDTRSAPSGSYRCRDGWFVVAVSSGESFRSFCDVIDAPELASDERLVDGTARLEHRDSVLKPRIERWAAELSADSIVERLDRAGIPAARVQRTEDLFECPHVEARGMIIEIDDPVAGAVRLPGNPVKLSGWPEIPLRPAPRLGADQERVLSGLRVGRGSVGRLRRETEGDSILGRPSTPRLEKG